MGSAHKQAEREVMEEFRHREYEERLRAEGQHWEAQSLFLQKLRMEAAQRRRAQRDEVESRRQQHDGALASAREKKVAEQEEQTKLRAQELETQRRKRLEERRTEQLGKTQEVAERLKFMEEQRQVVSRQKVQAYEEKHARMQAKEQQKAETRWQVLQIWAKSEELRKYTRQKMAAGKHEELLEELQEMRLESPWATPSPSGERHFTFSEALSSPATPRGFAPPARSPRVPRPPRSPQPGLVRVEAEEDGTYETLMRLFESKVKMGA